MTYYCINYPIWFQQNCVWWKWIREESCNDNITINVLFFLFEFSTRTSIHLIFGFFFSANIGFLSKGVDLCLSFVHLFQHWPNLHIPISLCIYYSHPSSDSKSHLTFFCLLKLLYYLSSWSTQSCMTCQQFG